MTITIHEEMLQGSESWFKIRCGMLTASEMKLIITPSKLEFANNDKMRAHFYELMAQRITGYVEPSYVSEDMVRGKDDEVEAVNIYRDEYAETRIVGFVTNDKWGFTLGCSPDALVGDDGGIEAKGRRQKFQLETILKDEMPEEFMIQVQTSMLVTERPWWDFISFCGGLPMYTKRIYADEKVQTAIVAAATMFEAKMIEALEKYRNLAASGEMRLIPTERRKETEIFL